MNPQAAQRWVRLRRAEATVRLLLAGTLVTAVAAVGSAVDSGTSDTWLGAPLVTHLQAVLARPALAVALGLVVVAPVLLVVAPLTGCAAVGTFAVVAVLVDDHPAVRVGAGVLAAGALLGAAVLVGVRRLQQRLVLAAVGGRTQALPHVDRAPFADAGIGRQALAALLVIGAMGGGARGVIDWRAGAAAPDLAWVLAAEAASLLGALLLARSVRATRAAGRALLAAPAPALPVLCALDDSHALLAVDGTVLARLPVVEVPVVDAGDDPAADPGADPAADPAADPEADAEDVAEALEQRREQERAAALAEAWRTDTPVPGPWREATAVGDLRVGGYMAVVLGTTVLLPRGTVRAWVQQPDDVPAPSAQGSALPGVPVTTSGPSLEPAQLLPASGQVVFAPSRRRRLEGGALLTLAVAALGGAAAPVPHGLPEELAVIAGAFALLEGWLRLAGAVVAGADGVVVPTSWHTVTVPWEHLYGVRRDGDRLALAWEMEHVMVGPFAGPEGPQAAAESAGVLLAALQRACERAHERVAAGAGPGPVTSAVIAVVRRRTTPGVRALAVYGPLAVLALVVG